jgi:hypothetical protein
MVIGTSEYVWPEDGDRIQSPKRCDLKNDYIYINVLVYHRHKLICCRDHKVIIFLLGEVGASCGQAERFPATPWGKGLLKGLLLV